MKHFFKNPKVILPVGALVLIYLFYKDITKLFSGKNTDDIQEESLDTIADKVVLTANITKLEAEIICNELEDAFSESNYGFFGTNEALIQSLLKSNYNTDARTLIYSTFGIRPYDGTGTPVVDFLSYDYTLGQWATAELSGDNLVSFQNYFKNTPFTI